MTNIICENDRNEYKIDIEGHSGYNPGNDIVCSASSILGYTLMNALMDKNADIKEITCDEAAGEIHIKIKGTEESRQDIRTIIETIMCGYELLMDQYPDNVNLMW